ncbi:MAG: acylneuraminate cytidylyltransferase family protein [Flavobacteriaceae bacterium]|nr:acylneuraminate cytidylyltransferase family protein [Flavobacteriaceae bacterium]
MKNKKNIVIIPARGGSKRLPNKNIKLLGNKSLIAHSIEYAQNSGINDIVVSTDDEHIKIIAHKYGVFVQNRPKHLATDISPTIDTLKYVIENLEDNYENVILLQPTNPLRPKNLLVDALRLFDQNDYDSLMAVTRNHQKFGKIIDNKFVPYNYEIGQRSQDLEPLYFENGLLYITKSTIIEQGKILGENNFTMITNHSFSSIDIDTQEDFDLAVYYYNKYKNE